MNIQFGNLLKSTWKSAQFCVAAWMGGKCGEGWAQVYSWPSPSALYLKLPEYYFFSPFFLFYKLIYLFFTELSLLAVQGMLPVRGSWGKSVLGFSLGWFPWVWSRGLEQWLCSCDTWASVLQGLRDLLGPGIKSMSLAWEGRFLTTRPAGKTYHRIITGYTAIQIKPV